MADADGKGLGDNHYSPNKLPSKGGFGEFLYNSEKGEILGRTGLSWAKILIFYVFFFIGLACFSGFCYFIFYTTTLDKKTPRWLGKNGLIGGNPGIGFRPLPDQDKYPESTLLWINAESERSESVWGKEFKKFIEHDVYINPKGEGKECNFTNFVKATEDHYCKVNVTKPGALGDCSPVDDYGYKSGNGSICVVIKLNKIFDWEPEPYLLADLDKANKSGMPAELLALIQKLGNDVEINKRKLQHVWISCEGENPGDKEAIGNITIIVPNADPNESLPGIPNYYFPYKNQEGYQPPFVLVKFRNPRPNTLIQVECKGWAKNIEAERLQRLGSTHFELMIDGITRPPPTPAPTPKPT